MINAYPQNYNQFGQPMMPQAGWQNFGGSPQYMNATANVPQNSGQFQTIDGVTWIQGEGAAKAYNVPAGKTVMLLDSESDRFYIKQADQYGRPQPLQVFRYTKDETAVPTSADFVTRKEFDELKAALDALQAPHGAETKEGE